MVEEYAKRRGRRNFYDPLIQDIIRKFPHSKHHVEQPWDTTTLNGLKNSPGETHSGRRFTVPRPLLEYNLFSL